MNFQKLKEILGSTEINEEQVKALDEFFSAYTEEVKKSVKAINESGDEMIPKVSAEKAFKEFQKDAEIAFNLFKEDSKKAFNLFKSDAEKAFDIYAEDLQNEYSLNMIKGFQELYEEIQDRVQKDFYESKDAKVLNEMKKIMTPLIASTEQQALLEEIDRLKSEKNHVINETKELTKENIINSLVKDFPAEYVEEVKGHLESAKDEDDIYERFSFICEVIDKKSDKDEIINEEKTIKSEKKVIVKDVKPKKKKQTPKKKQKKIIVEDGSVGGSVRTKTQEPKIKSKEKKYFSEEDDALINMLFTS